VAEKTQIAVGLDAGSAWTRLVVCQIVDGSIRYLTHAVVPSRGWRRGQIADQSALAESIRKAVRQAEENCGVQIHSAVVGVGGPGVRSVQGRGLYEFGHRREIEKSDLSYAVDLAARARLDEGRFLLQVLPQDFTVDGRQPVSHPLKVECMRLEAHALLITTSTVEHQMLVSAVHQAHLRVQETVFEAMAAAYACIMPEERAAGAALIDLGAHSSNVLFYDGDSMVYATGMPLSSDHFTRDLGELKSMSFEEAERLKIAHGCALVGLSADNIVIELPADEGRPAREISRRELVEILEARAVQLCELVEQRRKRFAPGLDLREGIVFTGGGALLEGMVEVAERELGCPARLGLPRGIAEWPDELKSPAWSTAAGLAMYSGRLQVRQKNGGGPSFWSLFALGRN